MAAAVSLVCAAGELVGRVVAVADGDTLTVLVSGATVVVRLGEIDAPEKGQSFGKQSKQSLATMCFGQTARVHELGKDRYGRTLGRVKCADVDVNLEQVKLGLAWVYTKYSHDVTLLAAQHQARLTRSGLWSDVSATPPWEWRREPHRAAP